MTVIKYRSKYIFVQDCWYCEKTPYLKQSKSSAKHKVHQKLELCENNILLAMRTLQVTQVWHVLSKYLTDGYTRKRSNSEYSCGSKAFCGLYVSSAVKVFSVDPNFLNKEGRPLLCLFTRRGASSQDLKYIHIHTYVLYSSRKGFSEQRINYKLKKINVYAVYN